METMETKDLFVLVQKAIESNMAEIAKKLLELQEKNEEKKAKEAYLKALAEFQKACPEITRDKVVMSKDNKSIRYRYASLDSIIRQIKELLAQHGFSYRFETKCEPPAAVEVTCVLSHVLGHEERASFKAVIEKDAFMGEIQKTGAAMSYAKRYSFCAVTGIMTADEDTDAQEEEEMPKKETTNEATEEQLKLINMLFHKLGITSRDEKLERVSNMIGRKVYSSRELTRKEASHVIEELNNILKKE